MGALLRPIIMPRQLRGECSTPPYSWLHRCYALLLQMDLEVVQVPV